MTQFPQHGEVITFSKAPAGSYCSVGTAYRVDRPRNQGDFRFVNVERGSATIDRAWAMKSAQWAAA